jgi:hypothetical protein
MSDKIYEAFPEALAIIPQQPFQFCVGTFPTVAVRSRNVREGIYAGRRSGKHARLPVDANWLREQCVYPFSIQVVALNRKQRKELKINEGEM